MDWFRLDMSLNMMDGNFFIFLGAIIVLAIIIGVGYGFYELHMYIRDKKIKNGKQPNCLNGSWKREKFPGDKKYTIVEDGDGKMECIKWGSDRWDELERDNQKRINDNEGEYKIVKMNSKRLFLIIFSTLFLTVPLLNIIISIIFKTRGD